MLIHRNSIMSYDGVAMYEHNYAQKFKNETDEKGERRRKVIVVIL